MGLFNKKKPYTTKEGYKQVYQPNHPRARDNGYVPEHIIKAEKKIGRPIKADEHVHHIDGKKLNNKEKNLEVLSPSKHAKLHNEQRKNKKN